MRLVSPGEAAGCRRDPGEFLMEDVAVRAGWRVVLDDDLGGVEVDDLLRLKRVAGAYGSQG